MRSKKVPLTSILSLLLTILATVSSVHAQDNYSDDYEVKARVVRISLISGEVNLKRKGNSARERARLNFPLVEGDTLTTDRESRVEIQIDGRNFMRLGADSELRIVTLRDEGVALSLVQGTASLRLASFDRDHEYFEVDAPKTTIAAQKKGFYRLDVGSDSRVRLTVRDGGRARIYSETSGFTLRDGHTAELVYEGPDTGDWNLTAAAENDLWDNWVTEREHYLAERLHYDNRYYDSYIWGAEDLDAYGGWTYAGNYGWVWRPHPTIISSYDNWAPYRHGYWTWCPPYGWTWVGDEPWGWAPYHYGRWVYYDNYWAWCPRSYYYQHRSWWRPALVAFASFNFSFGSQVCWYPLSYHQRDPRAIYFRGSDRLTPLRANELANLQRVNPAYLRAVTALPARDFGNGTARLQPASAALARRAIIAEPVRGDLPIRPASALPNSGAAGRSGDVAVARPARVVPSASLPSRPTGATTRTPGVPLDTELRRTRILNGRDPVPSAPAGNAERGNETRATGFVARPARPAGGPINRGSGPDGGAQGNPTPTGSREERPPTQTPSANREPRNRTPASPPNMAPGRPPERVDRPAQPAERREFPAPRPQPPTRYEAPPQRSSPPPAQRPDPPARSNPPSPPPTQRPDPPARSSPPSPPPTQRSEPPARSTPPPQRSEPTRQQDRPARVERKPDG